jgi:hypothetical protein
MFFMFTPAVLRIRIRMYLGLLNPDPDPLVRGIDQDPDLHQNIMDPQHCLTFYLIFHRTCRNTACDALICEESMKPVQIGAGVRIHADCTVGHKNIWDSCEFANKTRTSILDIMISVFQLTIGLNMSQVRLALIKNSIPLFCTDPGIQKAPDPGSAFQAEYRSGSGPNTDPDPDPSFL